MNWYDELTDEQIEELKNNEKPLGLCEDWMQEVIHNCESKELQLFLSMGWSVSLSNTGRRSLESTYRLRPDWQRPEKEKKYKLVEYAIYPETSYPDNGSICFIKYYFKGLLTSNYCYTISQAPDLQGFVGYKFEETRDLIFPVPNLLWRESTGGTITATMEYRVPTIEVSIRAIEMEAIVIDKWLPATPRSVVFMEEENGSK